MALRKHIFVSGIIICTSGVAGYLIYNGTEGTNSLNTAITVVEGGIGIVLSYLLVVLYKQQKDVLETDIQLQKSLSSPYLKVDNVNFHGDYDTAYFELSNTGNGTADDLIAELVVRIQVNGQELYQFYSVRNLNEKYDLRNVIFDNELGNYMDIEVTSRGLRGRGNRLRTWIARIAPVGTDRTVDLTWQLKYRDSYRESDHEMITFNQVMLDPDSDQEPFVEQFVKQLSPVERTVIQQRELEQIGHELEKTGVDIKRPTEVY